MTESERIAEEIILLAHSKGKIVSFKEVKIKYGYRDDFSTSLNTRTILDNYGDSLSDDSYYKLNNDGIEFASGGCFSGKEKRDRLAIRRANLSLWFSGIAILISLLTLLFNNLISMQIAEIIRATTFRQHAIIKRLLIFASNSSCSRRFFSLYVSSIN